MTLGDLAGGVAAIVTLLYLAIQIRQNTRSLRASTFRAVADSISALASHFGVDAELGRIFTTGLQGVAPLSETEERQFGFTSASPSAGSTARSGMALARAGRPSSIDDQRVRAQLNRHFIGEHM